VGSFFYDFLSFRDALKRERPDIIYVAGYTSIVPAYIWYNGKNIEKPIIMTNMDGLEYKRTKYNEWVRAFLVMEERIAMRHSRYLISDNVGIQDYYKSRYHRESTFLAYGADIPQSYDELYLSELGLEVNGYFLLVARMEPENNIAMAIEGYLASKWHRKKPLIIVGKPDTPYGKSLLARYGTDLTVRFIGGVYDIEKLNSLRYFSFAYFHGHSVGGTNPSLLEAMACRCFILAHDNVFNKAVLGTNAYYYADEQGVVSILNVIDEIIDRKKEMFTAGNIKVIRDRYSWEQLTDAYEEFFEYSIDSVNRQTR